MEKWIIFGGNDWFRPNIYSTRHIMYQFKKNGYKVLWINPIPFKSPAKNSANRKSQFKKIFDKLKTHLKIFTRPEPGLFVYVPIYLPLFNNTGDRINSVLIRFQTWLLTTLLNIKIRETILWLTGSFTLAPILSKPFLKTIYQAADLISDFETTDGNLTKRLKEKEAALGKNVDYLFASSPNIKEKLNKLTDREITLLTHGVNFTHFNTLQTIHPKIAEIKKAGLPVAGYFGTLFDRNTMDVYETIAANGFSVVIAGKVLGDFSSIEKNQNIHFLGPVKYEELPSVAQSFDVCLLNRVMTDWVNNSYPIKILEYLAMGKPIVSCPIPVVKDFFGPLVYFAEQPHEYLEKAKLAINEDNHDLYKRRIEAASTQTWESKFEIIKSTLEI